ncbi:MAG: hypothetical protein ACKO9Z_11830, partial [Planctomycetota bacterium]
MAPAGNFPLGNESSPYSGEYGGRHIAKEKTTMTQPTIAISTNRPNLIVGVAACLEARGLSVRLARGSRKDDFQVTYKPGVSL